MLKYEYIDDYVLIEVIRDKFFCKNQENNDKTGEYFSSPSLVCPYNDESIMECFMRHSSCKPKIFSKTIKYNIDNQLLFHISHCYCDRELYNCLRRVSTTLADSIASMYFNHLKIKCFYFEYRYNCKFYVFGRCLVDGESLCHAKLVNSPYY